MDSTNDLSDEMARLWNELQETRKQLEKQKQNNEMQQITIELLRAQLEESHSSDDTTAQTLHDRTVSTENFIFGLNATSCAASGLRTKRKQKKR